MIIISKNEIYLNVPHFYVSVPMILEGALSLTSLQKCSKALVSNEMGDKMLRDIFKLLVVEKGPNYLKDMWQSSNLKLTDFMTDTQAESFIEDNVS